MNPSEIIRSTYPHHLAKVYETTQLEKDDRQRVRKLVALFEETVRDLALDGLAIYRHRGLQDTAVEQARTKLTKPTLGHWLDLLKKVDKALDDLQPRLLTPPLNKVHRNDAISEAVPIMARILNQTGVKKVKHVQFLDTLVTFRNNKIGHGALTKPQARQVVGPLAAAMDQWLAGLAFPPQWKLVAVESVIWEDPNFLLSGYDLNAGVSAYLFERHWPDKLSPKQVYLQSPDGDELIPLHPFYWYDFDRRNLYIYHRLTDDLKRAELACPYDPDIQHRFFDVNKSDILGARGARVPRRPSTSRPAPTSSRESLTPMRNWFDIIPPHEDIRQGHFDEAIFAADLGDVASGQAPADYSDPFIFFKKTYPTAGLKGLLSKTHAKLTEGKGPAVIQIQTPFGGGKTHALVTLYHYVKHGDRVKTMLPAGVEPLQARVAVIAGNHWNPLEGRTTDGITRYTFWGEIAYQLGGSEGYEQFRENDQARISPGKDKLVTFLRAQQPFIILFDEILHYVNRAMDVDRDKAGASLGTQTFSFFQELTEAVSILPKGMLVVTLPSSILEDFGPQEQEALARMGKIFGRVESIETPVQGEEIYAIIRRRLFDVEQLKQTDMREVVHSYSQYYQHHRDDVPDKAREVSYRDKMEKAFPFHPEVIDVLYEKWSTYPSFQRTRGVLRLLANVVEDLYNREVNVDLILPGDINLDKPAIRQEFIKHIGNEYEGVIASDIAGHNAKAQMLDHANRPWKHLAQRIATTIFFHSFSADEARKGITLPYIKLGTMRAETMPALITEVLQRLNNTLWYLNSRGDAYFFSHIPNLNRMILDKKELFNESYRETMREIIARELGRNFRNYLWPERGEEIPDDRELKLIVLQPEDDERVVPGWLERKGESFRQYQNTLFFALPDAAAFGRFREHVKTYLALKEIESEVDATPNSPLVARKGEIRDRKNALNRDFSYNVRQMYHRVHLGDRIVDLGQPVTGTEALGHWYWRELTSSDIEAIVTNLHYRFLVRRFLTEQDQVPTAALLEQFYKNLALPVPSEENVVARAIQLGIKDGAFGLVQTENGDILPDTLKYQEDLPLHAIVFQPGFLLLAKPLCERIRDQQRAEAEAQAGEETTYGTTVPTPTSPTDIITPPPAVDTPERTTQPERYHRIRLVISDIPASKIADVNRGILRPIVGAAGDFTFTLTIDVTAEDGIDPVVIENQIKETIRQIGGRIEKEDLS